MNVAVRIGVSIVARVIPVILERVRSFLGLIEVALKHDFRLARADRNLTDGRRSHLAVPRIENPQIDVRRGTTAGVAAASARDGRVGDGDTLRLSVSLASHIDTET